MLGTTPSHNNPYALLTEVHHPTGAKTIYTYESNPVKRLLASSQVNEVYRIASRHDVVAYSDNTFENYNYASLVYSTDMGATYGSDATITTTLFNNLLETKETYFRKFISKTAGNDYYLTERTVNDGTLESVETFTHDQAKRRVEPISSQHYYKHMNTEDTTIPITSSRIFDDYKNVTSETNAQDLTASYVYDATTHRLVSSHQQVAGTPGIYTEVVSRNAQGDVTELKLREKDASGKVLQHVQYEYDSYGNATLISEHGNNDTIITEVVYSSVYHHTYPTKITRSYTDVNEVASEQVIEVTYQPARGTMLTYKDGKNQVTSYSHDALNRLTSITYPDQSVYQISYSDELNEITEINEDGIETYTKWNPLGLQVETGFVINQQKVAKLKTGYDAFSRPIWNEDALGTRTVNTYDKWNQLIATTLPNQMESTVVYDPLNYTVEMTNFDGTTIRETYDQYGRTFKKERKDGNAYLTFWIGSYDLSNRLLTAQDGKNHITTYTYDLLSRMTSVTGADLSTYQYEYDRAGNMTKMISPKNEVTTREYDQLGRLIRVKDPLLQEEKYEYDGNSNVKTYRDKKGQTFSYTYNKRNLLTEKSGPVEAISYTYSNAGLRETMKDNGNRVTGYHYDDGTSELDYIVYPDGKIIDYDYDAAGKVQNLTLPFLDEVSYEYDTADRIQQIKWNGVTQASYQYRQGDQLQSVLQANGVSTQYGYDGANRLESLTHELAANELNKFIYGFDNNDNISSITEQLGGVQSSSYDFTYDAMNRILTSSQYNEIYDYDANGNRQSVATDSTHYIPAAATYEYDQWNRLTKVTTEDNQIVEYVYNGDDLMVERKENGTTTRYYYDGGSIIAEGIVGAGNTVTPKASYLYGSTGLILREDEADSSKAYYVTNAHGDVTEIRNAQGGILNSYSYDIWGNVIEQTGSLDNPFLYSGEYWDATTQLQYLRARWYDPSMGRFINEDTYEGQIDNPLTLNLYTYVANNPLKYIDPTGNKMEIDKSVDPLYNQGERHSLKQYENDYWTAHKNDDRYGMQAAHDAANLIRLRHVNSVKRVDFINGGSSMVSKTNNTIISKDTSGAVVQTYVKGEVSLSLMGNVGAMAKVQANTLVITLSYGANGKVGASATLTGGVSFNNGGQISNSAYITHTQQLPYFLVAEGKLNYDFGDADVDMILGGGIGVSAELPMYIGEFGMTGDYVTITINSRSNAVYPMTYNEWMNHLGR